MKSQPPSWAQRLLEYFCDERLFEEIEGDLQERFQRRSNVRPVSALSTAEGTSRHSSECTARGHEIWSK